MKHLNDVNFTPKELEIMAVIVRALRRDVMTHGELRETYRVKYGMVAAPTFITKEKACKLVYHKQEIRGCYYLPVLEFENNFPQAEKDIIRMNRQKFVETTVAPKEHLAAA